jgi:hypothetical protein
MTGQSLTDMERVASTFGVGMEQVRRDHLISHVLAAIATTSRPTTSPSLAALRCRGPISPKRASARTST